VIEDCLQEAAQYAKDRQQHGKAIARHQLIQEHIAEIEMARQTTAAMLECAVQAKSASDGDPGSQELFERADILVAKVKLHASNAACQAADRAIQVFGGRGYSELFRPARHWQDVRVCRIYEGTDEILKLKIAASVLGKEYAAFR
jgi:alkylation response protein AidB-like acyl-CoA dehydrogenase